jgi:hypothetical protein
MCWMLLSLSSCYFWSYCCSACVLLFVGVSVADLGGSENFSGGSNSWRFGKLSRRFRTLLIDNSLIVFTWHMHHVLSATLLLHPSMTWVQLSWHFYSQCMQINCQLRHFTLFKRYMHTLRGRLVLKSSKAQSFKLNCKLKLGCQHLPKRGRL